MQLNLDAIATLGDSRSLILGSDGEADIVVLGPGVEKRHAQLLRLGSSLTVQDLDSGAGTFLNGQEVRGRVEVRPGDRLRLGGQELVIPDNSHAQSSRPHEKTVATPFVPLALSVVRATKTVCDGTGIGRPKRAILDHVSFRADPGEFVGILGASGSGKSTLIRTVAGLVELTDGAVLLNGQPASSQVLRAERRIAYLPQDVVIHEALTPEVALGYIARLKGLTPDGIHRQGHVQSVLERVGLWEHCATPIHRLSGGQRKRAALAAELLGDPALILLDEATSGLDPATEGEMMLLFRSLAREGRTVVCITHFPGRLHLCDRLLYLMQGKCVFFGTPAELKRFFAVSDIEDVYARQNDRTAQQWEEQFRQSADGQQLAARVPDVHPGKMPDSLSPALALNKDLVLGQTRDLFSRYIRLQLADWKNLLLLFAQAPIIALMLGLTFGVVKSSFAELHAADTKQVLFILVLAILWCSGTASVREVVKELPIVQHEARFGVGLLPYLLSKFFLLGLISLAQAASLLLIVRYTTKLTGFFDLQMLILGGTALVGVALGLLVSAAAGTSERAMTILPVLLIGQAIFSGGLARLTGWAQVAASLFVPAYWSLNGLKAPLSSDLLNATYPGAPGHYQPPILGSGGPLALTIVVLAGHTCLFLLGTLFLLQQQVSGVSMTGTYYFRKMLFLPLKSGRRVESGLDA